jgi:unsaturated rhamnogalacturonyl hydrolase
MKITRCILLVLAFLATACGSETTPQAAPATSTAEQSSSAMTSQTLSVWMADSDMQRNPEGWMIDFQTAPKWEYTHGLMMTALEKVWQQTGDDKYLTYMQQFADLMIEADGTIKTYDRNLYNIDRINPGKFLIGLYRETGDEKYRLAVEKLRDQMREHPRTSEGGFWHKKVYPHQMWLDGLYMGAPFLAQYAAEFNEPELFDDVINQFRLINKYTWDNQKKIFYHGWDESREQRWADPETGLSPNAWGRAMGWLATAIVDALDFIPNDHPDRGELLQVAHNMAEAITAHQDLESGLWWQVVDQGGREGNYLESSASSMFTYFLLKATDRGYLDQSYRDAGLAGYRGILEHFIRHNADGTISITDVCAVAGLGGNPYRDGSYEYYIGEPRRADDPKAVGPFIMASLLYEALNH